MFGDVVFSRQSEWMPAHNLALISLTAQALVEMPLNGPGVPGPDDGLERKAWRCG